MPIEVSCPCGMRSRGPDSLAGQQAKCPQCGRVLNIPQRQQTPVLLTPLEPLPQVAQKPLASYQPLGPTSLAGLPVYDPLARPQPQQTESVGIPAGVWIGLGCGVGGAVLAALVAIVVVSMSGGSAPVVPPDAMAAVDVAPPVTQPPTVIPATSPATTTPSPPLPVQGPATSSYPMASSASDSSSAAPVTNPSDSSAALPSSSVTSSTTDSPSSSVASSASPMTTPDLSSPRSPASADASSDDNTGRSARGETSPAPLALLGPSTERWRSSPQSNLRGMQRFPDKLHIYGYSWMVELLPHLGHEKTYAQFDFSKSWLEGRNLAMTSEVVPAFLNPADGRTRSKGYPHSGMGLTHYVGMAGIEDARNVVAGELPRSDPRAGVFGYDEVARPDAITDGQSQTILLIGSGNLPAPWVQGGGATVRGARDPYFDTITGFGSKGLGSPGAQVLMADGSVRAISASIDPTVFKAMCTIHGADSVDLQSAPFIPAETTRPETK